MVLFDGSEPLAAVNDSADGYSEAPEHVQKDRPEPAPPADERRGRITSWIWY